MRSSDGIVGLTLTELAFLIVLCVIVFLLVGAGQRSRLREQLEELERQVDALRVTNAELMARNDELSKENDSLRQQLEQKRSVQLPSCVESGVAKGRLFQVTIVGADRYLVDVSRGAESLDQLRSRFSSDIELAIREGCVQSVTVLHQPGLAADDYVRALRELRRTFYAGF